MIWLHVYAAVGVFTAIAALVAADRDGELRSIPLPSIILFGLFLVVFWPALIIYKYIF